VTILDVRRADKAAGLHFFDEDTMDFFKSRIESEVVGDGYFLTSEQNNANTRRMYTLRQAQLDGSINTVGEFQQYKRRMDAERALKEHI
jgi:hypothetical protein